MRRRATTGPTTGPTTGAVAGCLGALLLVASACSDGEPDDRSPEPTSSGSSAAATGSPSSESPSGSAGTDGADPSQPAPDGPVTAFDGSALSVLAESDVVDVAAGGDTALVLTPTSVTATHLPDLSAVYSLPSESGSLVDVVVAGGDGLALEVQTVPGSGTRVGSDVITVRRFDLETGEETGRARTEVPQDPTGPGTSATGGIVAVAGGKVVVTSGVASPEGVPATAVLDLGSGKAAWKRRGSEALTLAGGLVVTSTGRADADGAVVARRLGSGKVAWTALPGTLGASVVGATERRVVVARDDNVFAEHSVTALSTRTGRVLDTRLSGDADWTCTRGTARIAVCSLPVAETVVGWDLGRHRPAWTLPTASRFAPLVTLAQDGVVYGLLDSGAGVVLRAADGRDVPDSGGAAPKAVTRWGGVVHYGEQALFAPWAEAPVASTAPSASPTG